MLRRILRSIGRALIAAFLFPFVFAGSAFRALIGVQMVPLADFEDDEQKNADPECDALRDLIEVKRWAAATLTNKPIEPGGRYVGWMRALDRECAGKIALAAETGRLRDHLEGTFLFPGIPPVGTYAQTRRWLTDRSAAGRRTEQHPVPEPGPSPEPQRFSFTP